MSASASEKERPKAAERRHSYMSASEKASERPKSRRSSSYISGGEKEVRSPYEERSSPPRYREKAEKRSSKWY